ncbi:MAG: AAA family ATPase [Syntrophorhabdales bacterium]|jgi:hypothetical protein
MSVDEYFKTGLELQSMDVHVEMVISGIAAKGGVTLWPGHTGISKTTLAMGAGHAVSRGEPFLGLATMQMPVYYLSYEDPLQIMVQHARDIGITDVHFCLSSFDPPPPRLDSASFIYMLEEQERGLVICDSYRAGQSGDENDSKDVERVMRNLKAVRDMGFSVLLLHNTKKNDQNTFRGSQSIEDQVDLALVLATEKKGANPDDPDAVFCLSTTKSRYGAFKISFKRAGNGLFEPVVDPEAANLTAMASILRDAGEPMNQSTFTLRIRGRINNISDPEIRRLLEKGKDRFWTIERRASEKNQKFYEFVSQPVSLLDTNISNKLKNSGLTPKPDKLTDTDGNEGKSFERVKFVSFSEGCLQTKKLPNKSTIKFVRPSGKKVVWLQTEIAKKEWDDFTTSVLRRKLDRSFGISPRGDA